MVVALKEIHINFLMKLEITSEKSLFNVAMTMISAMALAMLVMESPKNGVMMPFLTVCMINVTI
jgi:hypothetical protein